MEQNSINSTMKKLIEEMEKGKKSTQILRDILLLQRPRLKLEKHDHGISPRIFHNEDYIKDLDHHCMVAFTSCVNSLSLMRSFDFESRTIDGKRKMDHYLGDCDGDGHVGGEIYKHDDLYGEVTNSPANTKNRRGCYKRRKSGEGKVEEVTQLRDDGYAWRKYGQKVILKTAHPRNYFRCTHKLDKKCPATKQVQQISDNPIKYKIIYHGNHICNYNNQSIIVLDNDFSEERSSGIVLSFDKANEINPLLFPTSSSSATAAVVKQECSSPLSDQSNSQDQTIITGPSSTTLVSEQSELISTAENYSSTAATQYEVEDDYFSMWTDLEELNDVFGFQSQDFGIHFH